MKPRPSTKPESAPKLAPSEMEPSRHPDAPPAPAHPAFSFKKILVPIDFSDCSVSALNYALALGRKLGTSVTLLHVVEPALYPENQLIISATVDEANQTLMATGRERLAELQARAAAGGLVVETLVRVGRAQSEISDTAKAIGSDLIVMGTHGYSGLKQVLLGGTAERVVRHASCPVLTVRHPGA